MKRFIPVLLILWALVFLGHSWEAGLKMDAMTYASVAKKILVTGDWKTLHYTDSAYADFYQHPPLVFWLQALVFKALGVSEMATRVIPALAGLGTLAGILIWGTIAGSPWLGFFGCLVLLTSIRYVKFASDFFLDGPLAFFLVWGSLFVIQAVRARASGRALAYGAGFGLCLAAAFMTKGMVALSLPLAGVIWLAFGRKPPGLVGGWLGRALGAGSLGTLIAVACVGLWVWIGGGDAFLREYWAQSVSGRLSGDSHFKPLMALLKTYWPWLPLFALGLIGNFRSFAAIHSLVILGAFCYIGHYLDHYLVPFYPMAALVSASSIAGWLESRPRAQERLLRFSFGAAVVLAVVLATLPVRLHSVRGEPLRSLLLSSRVVCQEPREYWITSKAQERWMALAVTLWTTSSEARAVEGIPAEHPPSDVLLIAAGDEQIPGGHAEDSHGDSAWSVVSAIRHPVLKLLQPVDSGLCP